MTVAVQGGYLSGATYCVQEFRLAQTVTGTRNVREPVSHARGRYHGRPFGPRPFVVTGRPGSGKTVAAQPIEAECTERDMDVLIASPTGMLAANCGRGRCCVSTTIHRAFFSEDMNVSLSFRLTVPGMGHQRTWHGEEKSVWARIWQLWLASGKAPVLVSQREIFSSYHRRYRIAEMRTFAKAGSSMHKLCSKCKDNIDVWTLLSHLSREEVRLSKPSEESLWNALGAMPFSTDISEKVLDSEWNRVPWCPVFCATRQVRTNDRALRTPPILKR